MSDKRIIIIAGPNGAGKSTFAREFLPNEGNCSVFVNADLIAAGLSPFAPEKAAIRAGRLMLEEVHRHAAAGRNFAFETTLSGRGYAPLIAHWQAAGYAVQLVFLRLPSIEMAVERVAVRVTQGGHNIPPEVIARRFTKGWHNFEHLYRERVDGWQVFDNSGESAVLLDQGGQSWGE
jgi:predicted ABC-type ATPase